MAGYLIGAGLFLGSGVVALVLARQVLRTYVRTVGNWNLVASDLLSSTLLGLGILSVLAAPAVWWWVNGSRKRYLWIISGPPPYDRLGSGPLQLWIGMLLVAAGVALFTVGAVLRGRIRNT